MPPAQMPLWKRFLDKLRAPTPFFFVSPPAISPNGNKKG